MEETPATAAPQEIDKQQKLSSEQRSKIMSDAAKRRWAKTKRARPKAPIKGKNPTKTAARTATAKKKAPAPREFSTALRTAEKRLAMAITQRSESAAKYAVLSAEIPSLQRLILALKNPLGAQPEYGLPMAPSLEEIVGDQPIQYQNPPRPARPANPIPQIPVPQNLHPANTVQQSRAGGGAIGIEVPEEEDEDKFLRSSGVAGGEWH